MDDKPNIVFILTDQMRWDCMSHVGHPVVDTPNIDEIYRHGVTFTAAYSSCPSCVAARASIFTGLTPNTHGRLGYKDRVPWNYAHMLPELLGRSGYQTHCVGKTHFYPQRKHCGFDSLDSYEALQNLDGDYVNDYFDWLRDKTGGEYVHETNHGVPSNSWNARPSALPEELHNNSWVATKSIEFIKRRDKTRPFFLNMSFHRPHAPTDPPQCFWDMYKDRDLPEAPVGDWAGRHDVPIEDLNAWHGRLPKRQLDQFRRAYYAQIAHIDSAIGRVMLAMTHTLEDPSRDTVYLFTSDHGEQLGDHFMFRKTTAYEGSAAVPLVISIPGGRPMGRCDAPAALEDLYPTVLDVAGVDIPERTEGRSLVPFLHEGDGPTEWRDYVHGEHSWCSDPEGANQFITDGKTKYIWMTLTGQEQLFDLESDPNECHDLARDPSAEEKLRFWRDRMIAHLAKRPQDGLSDGGRLIPGKQLPSARPELLDGVLPKSESWRG